MLPCCMLFLSSKYRMGHSSWGSYPVLVPSCCFFVRLLKYPYHWPDLHNWPYRTDCTEATQPPPSQFQSFLKTGYSCLKYRLWSETHGQNDRVSLKHCSSAKPWFFACISTFKLPRLSFYLGELIHLSVIPGRSLSKQIKVDMGISRKVTSPFCTETTFNCSLYPQSIQVQLKVLGSSTKQLNKEHEKQRL